MTFVKFEKVVHNGRQQHNMEDEVVVLEKLDAANASVTTEYAGSRNLILTEDNTLNGWLQASEEVREKAGALLEGRVLYGEWLTPHTVEYKQEYLNKFYPFALLDKATKKFLPWDEVVKIAEQVGLKTPKVHFRGKYRNVAGNLPKYVGLLEMTVEKDTGEGVVVFNEKHGYRTKVVSPKFHESKGVRKPKIVSLSESAAWALPHATEARFEKLLHKFLDEGVFKKEDFVFENFVTIASTLAKAAFEDILEEESDSLPEGFSEKEARKTVNKRIAPTVRNFIEKNLKK